MNKRSLLSLSLIVAVAGCHPIVVGICDCYIPGHKCCYGCCAYHQIEPAYLTQPAPVGVGTVAPPMATPETVNTLPKVAPMGGGENK